MDTEAEQVATEKRTIIVRHYGGTVRLWPQAATETIVEMDQLWNELVQVERAYRQAVATLTATDTAVKLLDEQIAPLEAERESLKAAKAKLRSAARSKADSITKAEDIRLAEIKAALTPLYAARKQAAATARANDRDAKQAGASAIASAKEAVDAATAKVALAKDQQRAAPRGGKHNANLQVQAAQAALRASKERLAAIELEVAPPLHRAELTRRQATVKARQEAAANGMYWGAYNAVLARYETARGMALKTGGELRWRRSDGTGTLVTQVLPPQSTMDFLRSGGEDWNVAGGLPTLRPDQNDKGQRVAAAWLRPYTDQRGKPRALAALTVRGPQNSDNGKPIQVVIDLAYHRPLPDDAEVVNVQLRTRRSGRRLIHSFTVTCRQMATLPATPESGKQAVGIDVGFRLLASGLRGAVAVWEDGRVEQLTYPTKLLERHKAISVRQGDIDEATEAEWVSLMAAPFHNLGIENPLRQAWDAELFAQRVSKKRSHIGLIRLLRAWPEGVLPDIHARLQWWLKQRDMQVTDLARYRDRTSLWQREIRRVWTKRLVESASHIVIEKLDTRTMLTKRRVSGEESSLGDDQRRNASIAAPGETLAWLQEVAAKNGVPVTLYEGKSTWICSVCGHEHKPAKPKDLFHICRACGARWDQDINAATNLLRQVAAPTARAAE